MKEASRQSKHRKRPRQTAGSPFIICALFTKVTMTPVVEARYSTDIFQATLVVCQQFLKNARTNYIVTLLFVKSTRSKALCCHGTCLSILILHLFVIGLSRNLTPEQLGVVDQLFRLLYSNPIFWSSRIRSAVIVVGFPS